MKPAQQMPNCSLSCRGEGAPMAVVGAPSFEWKVDGLSGLQQAYRVVVNSQPENHTLWDSGWIESNRSAMVTYGGKALETNSDYTVTVSARYPDGTVDSAPVSFSTGLQPDQWKAGWLTAPDPWSTSPCFRKEFRLNGNVRRARLFVSGLGYYESYINGHRIGDHKLDPSWTDYNKRVNYATYDVTSLLARGENVIGVNLGNGWYAAQEYRNPAFTLQMHVQFQDGGEEWILSGPWQGWMSLARGPMLRNSLYVGEVYDARQERAGWSEPGFQVTDEANGRWSPAIETESPAGVLVPQTIEPIRVVAEITPQWVKESASNVYVVDFGQNLAGVVRLQVRSAAGTHIIIRHSEILNDDLTLNMLNLRSAKQTDEFFASGGETVYEPRFTYHGFRYVEVSGLGYPLRAEDITALCLRNDVAKRGDFECSDDLVNRIQKMCVWTESNNLHGVPTDCPQRDERLGWLNDLTVRAEEAIYNFDMHAFFTKYMADIADAQGPITGVITDTVPYVRFGGKPADAVCSSYLVIPWLLYQHYGDQALLERHYQGLAAWTDYLERQTVDGIVSYSYYGDWAAPIGGALRGSAGAGAVSAITPGQLMSTGFLRMNAQIMARIARVLGKQNEVERYENLAERTGEALNRVYLDREKASYATGSQASNTFMLYLGVVPEELREKVAKNLADNVLAHDTHLTTGNLCSRYILEVLSEHDYLDLAYALATQTTYPSWGYMLECGATTTWERWEHVVAGEQLGMASHDHPMYATVSAWFYRYLAGIRTDAPGFDSFVIRPYLPEKLAQVSAGLKTVKGDIHVKWAQDGKQMEMELTIPSNSTCRLELPPQYSGGVFLNGLEANGMTEAQGRRALQLLPGFHKIVAHVS